MIRSEATARHDLSADDQETIRRDAAAPIIRNELTALAAMVADGVLADDRLAELLRWLEQRSWRPPHVGTNYVWVRLTPEQVERARRIAAAEVARRGGYAVANGYEWYSPDGVQLKLYLPGGAPRPGGQR